MEQSLRKRFELSFNPIQFYFYRSVIFFFANSYAKRNSLEVDEFRFGVVDSGLVDKCKATLDVKYKFREANS